MFWIDKNECLQHGRKIIKAGDPIPDDVSKETIARFQKTGQIGTSPQVVESESTERKLEAALQRCKGLQDMLREKTSENLRISTDSTKSDKIKKENEELTSMVESLDSENVYLKDMIKGIERSDSEEKSYLIDMVNGLDDEKQYLIEMVNAMEKDQKPKKSRSKK